MAWLNTVRNLLHDERGTSAVEMGLICALVVLAMLTALDQFANENDKTWNHVSNSMRSANAGV